MRKLIIICLLLAGCSTTDMLKSMIGGGGGLEVSPEVTFGNKSEELQLGNDQLASTINNSQEIPIEFMVLLCLGWLLPSPNEMFKGAISVFKRK